MNEAAGNTDWAPGLIVLGIGLLLGLVLLILQLRRTKAGATKTVDETSRNLERRVQMILEQLRELAADRHQLGDERYNADRARLELEAAAALRARDEYATGGARSSPAQPERRQPVAAPEASPAKGWSAQHPQLVGALWGGGVVLFFVVLGIILSQEQKPRMEPEKGASRAAGPMQQQKPAAPSSEERDLQEAMAKVADHPEDLDMASRVAHELIRLQRFDDAERITEQSLGFDPFHLETRIHRAVLRTTHGQSQQAVADLEHLAVTYPHSEEARLFLGGLRMEIGDRRGALEAFERYLAEAPPDDMPPQLPEVVAQLRNALSTAPTP